MLVTYYRIAPLRRKTWPGARRPAAPSSRCEAEPGAKPGDGAVPGDAAGETASSRRALSGGELADYRSIVIIISITMIIASTITITADDRTMGTAWRDA